MFIVFRIMKINLSDHIDSITGSLGQGFGYHIQHRKKGFFSKRNSKGQIPPDGHWRLIVACAELAKNGLYVSDISLTRTEMFEALTEANLWIASGHLRLEIYHAQDVINFKKTFGL